MTRRVAITGVGVVTPVGVGGEAFWQGLTSGVDAVTPIEGFDCAPLAWRTGAQVRGLDAGGLLGRKGLKYVDRLSQFALAATQLALDDAGLDLDAIPPQHRGVVIGTTFGNLASQQDLNRERITDGPSWVSPMKFPNTPINALSYQIPIRHQMRLANVTIPAGITAGLEAVRYSLALLERTPDALVLCGGADELSFLSFYGAARQGVLAGPDDVYGRPFDRDRHGLVHGEGAAMLALRAVDAAPRALATIDGYGRAFSDPGEGHDARVATIARAIRAALDAAGCQPAAVSLVLASASGSVALDAAEAQALALVFGPAGVPVTATKALTGETYGAAGGLQIAAGVLAMCKGVAPPTWHLRQVDASCPVDVVTSPGRPAMISRVLVTAVDDLGGAAAVVLTRNEAPR